jgi:hypothetical protein
MTTAVETYSAPAEARAWFRRLAPLGGLGIVAGLILLLVSPAGDDTGETPAAVVAYAASHEGWIAAFAFFALGSILLGGAFVAGVHARLREIATPTESTLVLIGGIAFTLCFALCLAIWMTPLLDMPDETARALVAAEAYLTFDEVGWWVLGSAGIGAALMAVPASLAAVRGGLVPSWLGWLGVVLGVLSLATITFLGIFAWMAWFTIASILMLLGRD